jgi:hypothetical protein
VGEHEAVRLEGSGGETCDQHRSSLGRARRGG